MRNRLTGIKFLHKSVLIGGLLLGNLSLVLANTNADYYDEHAQGWHWYAEPPVEKSESSAQKNQDAVAQMSAVKQTLQRALDAAILEPTPQHVKNYIVLQNAISEKASRFSTVWQQVLWQNPQLNYTIAHPTNQIGRAIYLDQARAKEDAAIRALAAHSGLFFFYRSTCPYCRRFAPIVKDFSTRYGIVVVPITTDGIALPEFPQSRVDAGQAAKFHITVEPALFTVNPYTRQVVPVSYGLTTEDELRSRIVDIAAHSTEESP